MCVLRLITCLIVSLSRMPVTPVTALLFEQSYVMKQWPILGSRFAEERSNVSESIRKCPSRKLNVDVALLVLTITVLYHRMPGSRINRILLP